MDNKMSKFVSEISKHCSIDKSEIEKIIKTLPDALVEICQSGDSVAIPGFGTFFIEKTDEHEAVDDQGQRWLMPPAITLNFRPSVILRKKLQ